MIAYYATSPMDDPTGASGGSHRVFRGGGWHDDASDCRASYRHGNDPGYRNENLGFRLARTVSSHHRLGRAGLALAVAEPGAEAESAQGPACESVGSHINCNCQVLQIGSAGLP